MNKAYRLLKNRFNGSVTVAHERAKGRGTSSLKKSLLSVAITAALMGMFSEAAEALPCESPLCLKTANGFNVERNVTDTSYDGSYGNYAWDLAPLISTSVERFHLTIPGNLSSTGWIVGLYNGFNDASVASLNNISNNVITVSSGVTIEANLESGPHMYGALSLTNYANHGVETITNTISRNRISNNGTIDALGDATGIALANQKNNSLVTQSEISENEISNIGRINSANEGVVLTNRHNLNNENPYIGTSTRSEISTNNVNNAGTIAAGYAGISLANFGNWSALYNNDLISSNVITNSGLVSSTDGVGIELYNDNKGLGENHFDISQTSNTDSIENVTYRKYGARSQIESNTITNAKGGRIVADDVGIKLSGSAEADVYTKTLTGITSFVISDPAFGAARIDASGAAITLDGESFATTYSQTSSSVSDNIITNAGTITSRSHGILIESRSHSESRADAWHANYVYNATSATVSSYSRAVAYAASSSQAISNAITNTGTITASDGIGIFINTSAYSLTHTNTLAVIGASGGATFTDASGSAIVENHFTSSALALNVSNTITNTGTIQAADAGIQILASAYSDNTATPTLALGISSTDSSNPTNGMVANGSRSSGTSVVLASNKYDNRIENSGSIVTSSGAGIGISAYATNNDYGAFNVVDTSGNFKYNTSSASVALAGNKYNHATNSGSITTTFGNGIAVKANAVREGQSSGQSGLAYANNIANTITNTGTIRSGEDGIRLSSFARARAYGYGSELFDGEGELIGLVGPYSLAGAGNKYNQIINSGSIVSTFSDGIRVSAVARSYAGDSSGNLIGFQNQSVAWNDQIQVTNSGSIVALAGSGISVSANAYSQTDITYNDSYLQFDTRGESSNNRVINSGSILAQYYGINVSAWAYGKFSENTARIIDNTIINTGSIEAEVGINVSANAVSNTSQKYSNDTAQGIGNTITNSGSIVAQYNGINLRAEVENKYDDNNIRTALLADNTITNTGTIRAGRIGILMEAHGQPIGRTLQISDPETYSNTYFGYGNLANNTISNSGLIVSTATTNEYDRAIGGGHSGFSDAFAIKAIGYANADPSGVIFDPSGTYFSNTLNLTAPAFIGGRLALQQEANFKVNLTSGPSHSNNWTFDKNISIYDASGSAVYNILNPSTNVTTQGAVPWFRNDTNLNYATMDPSAFAATPNLLADTASMVSGMSKSGLDRNVNGQKSNTWLSVQGNYFNYDGDNVATLKQKTRLYGIAGGYSEQISPETILGATLGYNQNELKVNDRYTSSFNNKSDGAFAGLFGRTKVAKTFTIDAALNGGLAQHNDSRFVNDNLEYLGVSSAKSTYNSSWLSPEVTLSLPYDVKGMFTLSPNVQLRYASQWIDGYTETGSHANAKVESRTVSIVDSKIGLSVAKTFNRGYVNAHISYLNRDSVGDDKVNVAMIGDNRDISFYYKTITAGVVGLDARYDLYKGLSIQASGNYMTGSNVSGGNLTGSIFYLF